MTDKVHKVITTGIYKRRITGQLSSWCIAISYLGDWYQPELMLAVIMGWRVLVYLWKQLHENTKSPEWKWYCVSVLIPCGIRCCNLQTP